MGTKVKEKSNLLRHLNLKPDFTTKSLLVFFLFLISIYTNAEEKIENIGRNSDSTLQITGAPSSPSIKDCDNSECTDVTLPEDFLKFFNDGYSNLSIEDITSNGYPEVILTGPEEGAVNICSKIYYYDREKRALQKVAGLKQICNFRLKNNHLISSYRSEAKWHEDVYRISGTNFTLELSDSCIGCDQVNRTIYLPEGKTDKLMVTNNPDYALRKPILSKVISGRAILYKEPSTSKKTKMYLIKNDSVALLDFRVTENSTNYWYEIKYITNKGKEIRAWMACEDLEYCK